MTRTLSSTRRQFPVDIQESETVELLQHEVTRVVENVAARVVLHPFEEHLEGDAVMQVLTWVESVAGFDDIEVASHLQPALTTVHMPTQALGVKTAEHLIARLAKKRYPRRTELKAELIVRGSTGPCPGRSRSG